MSLKWLRLQVDTRFDSVRVNMWIQATAVLANWMVGREEDDFWEAEGGLERVWRKVERENRAREEGVRKWREEHGEYRSMRLKVPDVFEVGDERMRNVVWARAEALEYEPWYTDEAEAL